METIVFAGLAGHGIELVERNGKYFVHYDAGAHQIAWREDELSAAEAKRLLSGASGQEQVMFGLQRRLLAAGVDPYVANWTPGSV
jgi:hypothetical protein